MELENNENLVLDDPVDKNETLQHCGDGIRTTSTPPESELLVPTSVAPSMIDLSDDAITNDCRDTATQCNQSVSPKENQTDSATVESVGSSLNMENSDSDVILIEESHNFHIPEYSQLNTDIQDSDFSLLPFIESNDSVVSNSTISNDMESMKSNGEDYGLSYDSEFFIRDKKRGSTVYYRCVHTSKGCKARVMSKLGQNGRALIGNMEQHSCHPLGPGKNIRPASDSQKDSMDIEEINTADNGNGYDDAILEPDLEVHSSVSGSIRQQRRFAAKKADKNLLEPLKFMDDFDPQKRSEQKKRKRYTDGRVHLVASDFEECDCLSKGCPGCHYPCKSCGDTRCGHECRQGRRWVYESIEIEGRGKELKNYRLTTHTTKPAN